MRKKINSKKDAAKIKASAKKDRTICINKDCRLRIKGCMGFEGCPGYMGRG